MSPWAWTIVGVVGSFLLGSIPSSYIVGRLARGIDLRDHGSGNLGTTNAFRVLGKLYALPVLVFDVGKGAVAAWIGLHGLPAAVAQFPDLGGLLCAVAAILGHSLSPFVGFKGGKGVATAAGAFVTLAPLPALSAVLVWGALLTSTRIMSIASLAAAVVLPVNLLMVELLRQDEAPRRWATFVVGLLVGLWVFLRHRSNIQRLREGKESALW